MDYKGYHFEKWMRLFDSRPGHCDPDSDLPEHSLEMMAKFAETFQDWHNVLRRTEAGGAIEEIASRQMIGIAENFGQWLKVYQECGDRDGSKEVAMSQLMKLADNPKDAKWCKRPKDLRQRRWERVFAISPPGSEPESRAKQRIFEIMLEDKAAEIKTPQMTTKI